MIKLLLIMELILGLKDVEGIVGCCLLSLDLVLKNHSFGMSMITVVLVVMGT